MWTLGFIIAGIMFVVYFIRMSEQEKERQNFNAAQIQSIEELCRGNHTFYEFLSNLGPADQMKQAGDKMYLANWIRPHGVPCHVTAFFELPSDACVNAEFSRLPEN